MRGALIQSHLSHLASPMANPAPPALPVELQIEQLREQVMAQKELIKGLLDESRHAIQDAKEAARDSLELKGLIAEAQEQTAEAMMIARASADTVRNETEERKKGLDDLAQRVSSMQDMYASAAAKAATAEVDKISDHSNKQMMAQRLDDRNYIEKTYENKTQEMQKVIEKDLDILSNRLKENEVKHEKATKQAEYRIRAYIDRATQETRNIIAAKAKFARTST